MAGIVAVFFLFYFPCLLFSAEICTYGEVEERCPSANNYCCGDPDSQYCCSYEESFGITGTDDGLSNGAIAGIVVGCLFVCALLGLLAFGLRCLKMKLDERVMERRSVQRRSLNRGSMNRESPVVRGSFKRSSVRTSSRRRDDREPLNTRESAVFTNGGLSNPGFEEGYRKPVARAEPIMQNGQHLNQNGRYHNGSKDDMEIIGLDDSPKMYDKRRHWEDLTDSQLIIELEESPKMNEKWRHANNQSMNQNTNSVDQAAVSMEAQLRYHQLQEQHKLNEHGRQVNAQHREVTQLQPNQHQVRTQLHANEHQLGTHLQSNSNAQDFTDGQAEPIAKEKKKKKARRNLPKRIRDSDDSKWSMGYTRETVIQLKRNPSSKCNSPTASKDFDPENPPGILKYRDSELSDYDSVLGDSLDADDVFDGQSFDRPQSGFFEKLTRRSPSPKQTLAVAPFRQLGVDNHQPVPMDQFLTLDPSHLKAHVASYSPSQLSPTGREGRYSYFSPDEDFDHSFAKSYPEFVQSKANQPKDVLPHLHLNQNGRQTPTEISNGVINSPKQYVDYNRAGEELRCTSL